MTDQVILEGGINYICNTIVNTFKYMGFGNGEWSPDEKIPANINSLKHEVYRARIMSAQYSEGKIIIFGTFFGSDIKDGDACKLTEIALFNTETYSIDQTCLLMKVFSEITLTPEDSKVVKITLTIQT